MAAQSSIAEELVYNSKPGAAPASVVRVNTPPFNKDQFTRGNETIMINIPSGKRGQYLDPSMSYLKFQLEVTLKKDLVDEPGLEVKALPAVNITTSGGVEARRVRYKDVNQDPEAENESKDPAMLKACPIIAMDGGAHSLINYLEMYHGSNQLVSHFVTYSACPVKFS